MNINGNVALLHPSAIIWQSLTDPKVMQPSIPGCELFEQKSHKQYQADIKFKITLLSINFSVCLDIIDCTENSYYRFNAKGNGGIAGDAAGCCDITLVDIEQGSSLTYEATVQLEGMLQKIAEPLIAKKAHSLIEKYFSRFEKAIDACEHSD